MYRRSSRAACNLRRWVLTDASKAHNTRTVHPAANNTSTKAPQLTELSQLSFSTKSGAAASAAKAIRA